MSRNKFLKLLFSALLIMTMAFTTTTSAYAATGTKKVTSSRTMGLALKKGQTGNSSEVTFRVSGLPANAVITKLEVNPGSLKSYSGAVLTNYLTVSSSNRSSAEKVAWNGRENLTLRTSGFLASKANGTYTISFNATCISGALSHGMILDIGSKTYSSPYITIYWDDSF
ncbi:hypothetical protein [Lacrimispora amygdalina]|uniref:hypothetical protein n=1 Tax=Lacrimispora amygdalina TaxID=253257 RepID=UPI000BE42810|nr:hypothetical protein [Lacrimispora amygdalina]